MFYRELFNQLLKRLETKVITKTVLQLLFDGYNDTLLDIAVRLNMTEIPFNKFAWFYGVSREIKMLYVCVMFYFLQLKNEYLCSVTIRRLTTAPSICSQDRRTFTI